MRKKLLAPIVVLGATLLVVTVGGCGSGSNSSSKSNGKSAGALSAEVKSAATGDVPDNQIFLTFSNPNAGYSIKYPEGWSRKGNPNDVTIEDMNNIVHVTVSSGTQPTTSSVATELKQLKSSNSSLVVTSQPQKITINSPAIKATYSTLSAANPVTGKRVKLLVDRYEIGKNGKVATVDLGTPEGVDNVDAYRMISESFRWK